MHQYRASNYMLGNMICRRWAVAGYIVLLIVVIVLLSGVLSRYWQPDRLPRLIVDDSVASDLHTLAEETWDTFLTVFHARVDCFGDVHLHAERALGSRAVYDPDRAMVTVRVPGTPAMLQSALIHEWAHHIEFQCEAHSALRQAFLATQGLPFDTPWRPDTTWADTPSEQYAEATIELVLGRREIPTKIRVTKKMVHVIEEWATGDELSQHTERESGLADGSR